MIDLGVRITADTAAAQAGLERVGAAAEAAGRRAAGASQQMADSNDRAVSTLTALRGAWGAVAGVVGSLSLAREAIQMADSVTILRNRLELATGSAAAAERAFGQLYQAAQTSRTSVTELGSVYATMARAGVQNVAVVQAIGNAMAVSGGSAESMRAALVQLGQGMSSGVLRGEELNSIMEQAPRLAQAMADGLGVPIGQLRRLGQEGELTSERIVEALMRSAPRLAEEVQRSTATVSQGWQVLSNAITRFVGDADKATGATSAIAEVLQRVARAIDSISSLVRGNPETVSILGALVSGGPFAAGRAARDAARNTPQGMANQVARLEGPPSIYDTGQERDPAWRAAQAAQLRQRMALATAAGLDTGAEDARLARSREEFDRREKSAARLIELQRQLSGEDEKYTKVVGELAQMLQAGTISQSQYNQMVRQAYGQSRAGQEAAKQAQSRVEAEQRAITEAARARSEARQAEAKAIAEFELAEDLRRNKEVKAAQDALAAAEMELENFGKLKSQIAETTLARLRDKQAAAGSKDAEALRLQIDAQEKLVKALRTAEERDASIASAKAAGQEWKRQAAQIEQALTDALMRGFESGRGFVDSFVSTIKSAFKSMVLQPVVRAIVQPVAGVVGSMVGMPALAGTGVVGGGMLSGVGPIPMLSSLAGSFGGFGAGMQAGASALIGEAGFAGAMDAGLIAMQSGNLAGGLGTMAGALGPYAAAAAALYSIYKRFDRSGTPHRGSVVGVGADGMASTLYGDPSGILNNYQGETDTALRALGNATTGSLNRLSSAFGGSGGFSSVLKFAADGTDASIGSFGITRNGRTVNQFGISSDYNKYGSDPTAAFQAYTRDVAAATRSALDQVGLPQWAREQFAKLGSDATIEQFAALADSVAQFQTALRALQTGLSSVGGVMSRVAGLGGDAAEQVVRFAGGIQAFTAQAMGYVQDYFSRDEIAGVKARELQGVLQGLGVGEVNSREQFRALVEGTDVGTESGRRRLATLLGAASGAGGVFDFLGETGMTLSQAASGAPSGALGELFSASNSAANQQAAELSANQVQATTAVRDEVRQLNDTMTKWLSRQDGWLGMVGRSRAISPGREVQVNQP